MTALLVLLLTLQRIYWPVPLDTLAIGHLKHTHVVTTGRVKYCRLEDDGDRHIRLVSLADTTKFIVAEIIPKLPLPCPKAGTIVRVSGITRMDTEHLWAELHPAEIIEVVP